MDGKERADLYRNFLAEQGYAPRIDKDGDVCFMCEGMHFYISIYDDDEYFRLVCADFWPIGSDAERDRVAHVAAALTARKKVAKVYPVRDDTWASVEMYCSPPDAALPVLLRAMGTLRRVVSEFRDAMHERA